VRISISRSSIGALPIPSDLFALSLEQADLIADQLEAYTARMEALWERGGFATQKIEETSRELRTQLGRRMAMDGVPTEAGTNCKAACSLAQSGYAEICEDYQLASAAVSSYASSTFLVDGLYYTITECTASDFSVELARYGPS
jgi:hypothetical protein